MSDTYLLAYRELMSKSGFPLPNHKLARTILSKKKRINGGKFTIVIDKGYRSLSDELVLVSFDTITRNYLMEGMSVPLSLRNILILTFFEDSVVVLRERSRRILQLRQQVSFNSKANFRSTKSPELHGTWVCFSQEIPSYCHFEMRLSW